MEKAFDSCERSAIRRVIFVREHVAVSLGTPDRPGQHCDAVSAGQSGLLACVTGVAPGEADRGEMIVLTDVGCCGEREVLTELCLDGIGVGHVCQMVMSAEESSVYMVKASCTGRSVSCAEVMMDASPRATRARPHVVVSCTVRVMRI